MAGLWTRLRRRLLGGHSDRDNDTRGQKKSKKAGMTKFRTKKRGIYRRKAGRNFFWTRSMSFASMHSSSRIF